MLCDALCLHLSGVRLDGVCRLCGIGGLGLASELHSDRKTLQMKSPHKSMHHDLRSLVHGDDEKSGNPHKLTSNLPQPPTKRGYHVQVISLFLRCLAYLRLLLARADLDGPSGRTAAPVDRFPN